MSAKNIQSNVTIESEKLGARLSFNEKYQTRSFQKWLEDRVEIKKGYNILDVGCGTGEQTVRFLKKIGSNGTISCLDINERSIKNLMIRIEGDNRVEAVVEGMDNLIEVINEIYSTKKFQLTHAAYSLYYAEDWERVLRSMISSTTHDGMVAIATPAQPHGLIDIASKYNKIPEKIIDSLDFGLSKVLPVIRRYCWEVEVRFFQSNLVVESENDLIDFYRATTYYDKLSEGKIREYVQNKIAENGHISLEKNSVLILGTNFREGYDSANF